MVRGETASNRKNVRRQKSINLVYIFYDTKYYRQIFVLERKYVGRQAAVTF